MFSAFLCTNQRMLSHFSNLDYDWINAFPYRISWLFSCSVFAFLIIRFLFQTDDRLRQYLAESIARFVDRPLFPLLVCSPRTLEFLIEMFFFLLFHTLFSKWGFAVVRSAHRFYPPFLSSELSCFFVIAQFFMLPLIKMIEVPGNENAVPSTEIVSSQRRVLIWLFGDWSCQRKINIYSEQFLSFYSLQF